MAFFDSIGKPDVQKLENRQDISGLIKALKYKDHKVRDAAEQALIKIGSPAVEPIIAVLPDEDIRSRTFNILGEIGDRRATEALLAYLNKKSPHEDYVSYFFRMDAARALGKIGDPRAAGPLTQALDDEHFEVIDEAYAALRNLGLPAGECLLPMLQNQKPALRQRAAELLGMINDSRAFKPLLMLLSDEDQGVRKAAAEALGRLGNPAAIPALTGLIRDKFAVSREAAFEAIWKMGKPDTSPLVDVLEADPEPYPGCRRLACEQLGKIGEPAVVGPLLKYFSMIQWNQYVGRNWLREDRDPLLKTLSSLSIPNNELFIEAMLSEDPKIRYAAAVVLDSEKIAQGFVVMGLEKKMEGGDVEIKLKTIRALRNFPAEIVSPVLSSAEKSPDLQIAKAAEEALNWVKQQKEQ